MLFEDKVWLKYKEKFCGVHYQFHQVDKQVEFSHLEMFFLEMFNPML